ncbi:hypothetical protein [Microbacterium sp. 13-71-7]|jgi:hypothetical protein|uniref:hypothetical protein n=1 Tax=Microbacterium sp. 13-71-7 TaxID=1970399 RepID=UPI0025EFBFF2|nr:hypothetical protein [Microbacterium sp. 13-71-7]
MNSTKSGVPHLGTGPSQVDLNKGAAWMIPVIYASVDVPTQAVTGQRGATATAPDATIAPVPVRTPNYDR